MCSIVQHGSLFSNVPAQLWQAEILIKLMHDRASERERERDIHIYIYICIIYTTCIYMHDITYVHV